LLSAIVIVPFALNEIRCYQEWFLLYLLKMPLSRTLQTRIPAVEIGLEKIYNRHALILIFLPKESPAMNADSFNLPPTSLLQDTMLLLAREQEWAEAYATDHPGCDLGQVYLRFLRDEMVRLLGEA